MLEQESMKAEINELIVANFELGTIDLKNDLGIISNGFIDSIGTLKLVSLIEDRFNIQFAPSEITSENLNSVNAINTFIAKKKGVDK